MRLLSIPELLGVAVLSAVVGAAGLGISSSQVREEALWERACPASADLETGRLTINCGDVQKVLLVDALALALLPEKVPAVQCTAHRRRSVLGTIRLDCMAP